MTILIISKLKMRFLIIIAIFSETCGNRLDTDFTVFFVVGDCRLHSNSRLLAVRRLGSEQVNNIKAIFIKSI